MNTVKYLIIPTLFNNLKNIIRYINIVKIDNIGCTTATVLLIIYTFFINCMIFNDFNRSTKH